MSGQGEYSVVVGSTVAGEMIEVPYRYLYSGVVEQMDVGEFPNVHEHARALGLS